VAEHFIDGSYRYANVSFFTDMGWVKGFSNSIGALIAQECMGYVYDTYEFSDSTTFVAKFAELEGVKFGWIEVRESLSKTKFMYDDDGANIFIEANMLERAHEVIRALFWRKFQDKSIVLNQDFDPFFRHTKMKFNVDELVGALPSRLAEEYADDFRQAFAVNESRALMLYGPPGSGKSTIARQVADMLKLRSFRLRVDSLDNDSELLYNVIELFRPDCIILDDFDRVNNQEHLLEMISKIRKFVKLIIATANNRSNIDEAIMRPERFDELGYVKCLDDDVVRNMLGDAGHMFEAVAGWPIAFISELRRRQKWQTPEKAASSIAELAGRVERLKAYEDDDNYVNIARKSGTKKLATCEVYEKCESTSRESSR